MTDAVTTRDDRLRLGAQAFIGLIEVVHGMTETNFKDAASDHPELDHLDPRDYKAAALVIRGTMLHNLSHADEARREGFLRALTDLICLVADDAIPGDDWDPIATTAASFDGAASTTGSKEVCHG